MAQVSDFTLDNQGFASFRTELNNILGAVNSQNSGTSRPSSAVAGTVWLDTTSATSPTLKFFDGSDDISLATIDYTANTVNFLDSEISSTYQTKSANFNASANIKYFIDTSSNTVTATLPASPTQGAEIRFVDVAGTFDSNNFVVGRNGKPIMGSASDLTVSTERAAFGIVFYDNTQGWLLTEK